MTSLAIIPARSGSVGVKGKNIRLLNGRPLISYAIESALASNVDRVILSTDSAEYAEIGKEYGAEVPFLRPGHLANSEAKAIDVVRHCLDFLKGQDNWIPDYLYYMQPTSPFREVEQINTALAKLAVSAKNSAISVVVVKEHPYYMFQSDDDSNMAEFIKLDNKPERRQDLPSLYSLNDNILISKVDYLLAEATRLVIDIKNFEPIFISEKESLDINTEIDFRLAELLIQN